MILVDTSGLVAAIDAAQPAHEAAREVLAGEAGPLVLSPFVLAEVDYLLATRVGVDAELALLREVGSGAYLLAPWADADVAAAAEVISKYRDQEVALADASIVVLAERYDSRRVLTLDERHFRVLTSVSGKPFTVLPADALRRRGSRRA